MSACTSLTSLSQSISLPLPLSLPPLSPPPSCPPSLPVSVPPSLRPTLPPSLPPSLLCLPLRPSRPPSVPPSLRPFLLPSHPSGQPLSTYTYIAAASFFCVPQRLALACTPPAAVLLCWSGFLYGLRLLGCFCLRWRVYLAQGSGKRGLLEPYVDSRDPLLRRHRAVHRDTTAVTGVRAVTRI